MRNERETGMAAIFPFVKDTVIKAKGYTATVKGKDGSEVSEVEIKG